MHPSNAVKLTELEGWVKDETIPAQDIETTLEERGSQYGKFVDGARIMQELKITMMNTDGWNNLSYAQQESLEMIAHKIGRILNGNPNLRDHWHDLAGYSTLIVKIIDGENP